MDHLPADVWIHHILPNFTEEKCKVLSWIVLRETCSQLCAWIDGIMTPRFVTCTLVDPRYDKKLDLTKHPSHFPPKGRAPLVHHLKTTYSSRSPTLGWIRGYFKVCFWSKEIDILYFFAERHWPLSFLIDEDIAQRIRTPDGRDPKIYTYDFMIWQLISYYVRNAKSYISRPFIDGYTRKVLELDLFYQEHVYPVVCDNQGCNTNTVSNYSIRHGLAKYADRYPSFKATRKKIIKEFQ